MRKLVFAALAAIFMLSSGFVESNEQLLLEETSVDLFTLCACHSVNFYYDENNVLRMEQLITYTQTRGACELFSNSGSFDSFVWDDFNCKRSELNIAPR